MGVIVIFIIIQAAMIATALWESRIEGRHIGAAQQVGWKTNILGTNFTEYHFWLFIVAYPIMLSVPLVIDFSWKLFAVLSSSYLVGLVLEDFMWFALNPYFSLRKFNSKEVKWYAWLKIGKFEIPFFYPIYIILAILIYLTFLLLTR